MDNSANIYDLEDKQITYKGEKYNILGYLADDDYVLVTKEDIKKANFPLTPVIIPRK